MILLDYTLDEEGMAKRRAAALREGQAAWLAVLCGQICGNLSAMARLETSATAEELLSAIRALLRSKDAAVHEMVVAASAAVEPSPTTKRLLPTSGAEVEVEG